MFPLSSLFVPVDLSRGGRAALAVARQLAEPERGVVLASHVIPPMMRYMRTTLFPYAALGDDEAELLLELRENAQRALQRILKLDDFATAPLGADDDTTHRLEILTAEESTGVAEVLTARLRETDATLVVIGHSGESALTPGLAGSVTMRLAAESPRPTLIVRPDDRRTVRHVVAALDMSPASPAVYEAALGLALRFNARLTLLTVIPNPLHGDVCGVLTNSLTVNKDALKKRGKKDTAGLLARYRAAVEVPFPFKATFDALDLKEQLLFGDPTQAILKHVARDEVDLLVLGRRSGEPASLGAALGRTTAALVGAAPCWTLVIPS